MRFFYILAICFVFAFVLGSAVSQEQEADDSDFALPELFLGMFSEDVPVVPASETVVRPSDEALNPIFIVSGLTASALEAKLIKDKPAHDYCRHNTNDWFDIWPFTKEQLIGPLIDCYVHNFELLFDPTNLVNPYSSNVGVDVRAKYFGTAGKNSSSWIQQVAQKLVPFGYTVDKDLFGLSYDWRLDGRGAGVNSTYLPFGRTGDFENFARLIEQTVASNGGRKAHMIGHSYGGPVIHNFLTKYVTSEWKQANIASFISLSGPFLGTPLSAAIVVSKGALFNRGPHAVQGFNPVSPQAETEFFSAFGGFPAVVELMPSEKLTPRNDSNNSALAPPPIVVTPSTTYYSSDVIELLADAGSDNSLDMRIVNNDQYNTVNPPEVPTLCLYGYGLRTAASFHFKDQQFQNVSKTEFSSGDTSILEGSLAHCRNWVGQQEDTVLAVPLFNCSHNGIINDTRTWDYVSSWLQNISVINRAV